MTAREYILTVLKQVIYEGGYASLLLREKEINFLMKIMHLLVKLFMEH